MTLKEAILLLEQYNRWRKGADISMPKQQDISNAIDIIVEHYKYA